MMERDVERRLVELARRHGGVALKWTSPGTLGVPDRLLFMTDGRLWLVELKRPGGRPRSSQKAMHRRLERLGWPVYVVDDADRFFAGTVLPAADVADKGAGAEDKGDVEDAGDGTGVRRR